MITDIADLENGAVVDADLCIVGAGAAGIAVAQAFQHRGVRVCLLESGGLDVETTTQKLADAEVVGLNDKPPMLSRFRALGGSMSEWGGACAPLTPLDFRQRPWVPASGWPFGLETLEPYYAKAQALLELGPFDYAPEHWENGRIRFLQLDHSNAETRLWQLSPRTNFGQTLRDTLAASDNIRVLLHATATEILTDDSASHTVGIEARSLSGKQVRVNAPVYVLAGGGVENARLMLLSNRVQPAGLGNGHDLVGRYFMQHPHVFCATVKFLSGRKWVPSYKDFSRDGVWLRARFALSETAQERFGALNGVATLVERFITDDLTQVQSMGYAALKRVALEMRRGVIPRNLGHEIKRMVLDAPGLTRGLWRYVFHPSGALHVMAEQSPNPDSRITLGDAKDPLGLPLPRVDWRLEERDRASVLALVDTVGQELERLQIGRVVPDPWLLDNGNTWPDNVFGGYHHMGTTRMASDPKAGVVDANAKVHGIDNLFIAGPSIFPTGGCSNPMLTLVATSLRLADHLQGLL